MSFKQTSDSSKVKPFETKEEAEQYLRDMQDKFLKIKTLILELEDAAFVCIVKTQKACQEKVNQIKEESKND